jgi:hypothetical protein
MASKHHWKSKALLELAPGAEWVMRGEVVEWLDQNTEQPTDDAIAARAAELQAAEPLRLLREERNRRLVETDWWVLPDCTPTEARLAYRQALRDITDTYTSLNDVLWPDKPE